VSPIRGYLARLRNAVQSATFSYMVALAMGGAAVVVSVFLPPTARGNLVATTTGATIGLAVGGLSLETFLIAQGRAWLEDRAGQQGLVVYLSTIPLSAGLGWAFTAYSSAGSPGFAALGAAILAAGTMPGAAGLSANRFRPVYRTRALFASAIPALYAVLVVTGVRSFRGWLFCWLAAQAVLAAVMWIRFGGVFVRAMRSTAGFPWKGLTRMVVTHLGAVAIIPAMRFDQLALARSGGASDLALYSLAITASEFAQAGSVVAAQRVLGDQSAVSAAATRRAVRDSVLFALAMSVPILAGLAVIGLLTTAYRPALLIAALLVPRSVFIVVGKVLSARQVSLGGEGGAALISSGTSLVGVAAYLILIPHSGAVGAALLTGGVFALHAGATAVWLRGRRAARNGSGVVEPQEEAVGELV
jgi:hypothetical protein